MSSAAGSPFWISNQGTNSSTLYNVVGTTNVSKVNINPPSGLVAIPTTAAGPQGPTGIVSNSNTSAFQLTPGTPSTSARFIFANLNGTISGWAGGAGATVQATTPGAVYTGLAINSARTRLYAANGAEGAGINVFDSSFAPVSLPGAFSDPNLPAGYVPFNVQNINGKLYVTFAPAGRANQLAATPGMGVVSVFDENGVFLQRLITGSQLAAPWGLAQAPANFGQFSGDLLVGNFSQWPALSTPSTRPPVRLRARSQSTSAAVTRLAACGPLCLGRGAMEATPTLSISLMASTPRTHGLFGAIATPLPAALPLFASGLAALGLLGWRRKRKNASA